MVRLPWYHGVIFLMFVALVAVSIGYYDQRRRLRTLTERQERDRRSVAGAPGSGDEANNCMHLSPYDHCLRRRRRYTPTLPAVTPVMEKAIERLPHPKRLTAGDRVLIDVNVPVIITDGLR